jgi:hypothetical protein
MYKPHVLFVGYGEDLRNWVMGSGGDTDSDRVQSSPMTACSQ